MVYRIEKTTRTVIYLKKAILIRSGSTKNYPIRNIKCTGKEEKINSLREGMHVRLEGMLVLPELPRNPGQFNRRIYESGKKIDFYLENPTVLEVKEQRSGVREVVEIWKTEMMNRCEKIYPDEDWQNKLALDRRGNIKDTLQNIALIIRNDENFKHIVYNEFKDTIDVIGPLPWKQVKPGWNDSDLANAKVYFERVYGIWSPTKFKDALLAVVSSDRLYHPIKDYFATLHWDGQERIDTLLIDYFGAKDSPYTRAVIRKTLVAAVARIYKPGVKFDSILVLNGPQGMGKSTFFAILGKQWFSDSLSISDMRDKTAAEKLLGNWILEISEMNGIRKTEVEVVKSFVTRQDDKFRQAYGVNVESHPRKCIIVGSTNSEGGFLRDVTGNRRFWPVHVPGTGKHHPWELDCVDQIWAEAIHLYNEGEELFLKGAEAEEAYKMQQEAMESDDREGIVQDYLDRLLPDNWASMDIYQRRAFLGGGEFETVGVKGTVMRERVCIMEIWVECFGKERQNLKKADSYEIEGILNKIGGWKKYDSNTTGKTKVPLYGVQKTFVRMDEKPEETR